jgi:hypothetical protein
MLAIKKHYCISFNRSIMASLIAVTLGIILLLGLVSQNSFAQNYMVDTNGDGVVDEQDIGAGAGTEDTNGDGVVDEQDIGAGAGTEDTNGDGVVDEQDTTTPTSVSGAETPTEDTNGDGVVDEQDIGTTDAPGTGTSSPTTTTADTPGTTPDQKAATDLDLEQLMAPDQKTPLVQKAPTTGATDLEQLLAPDQKATTAQKAASTTGTGATATTTKAGTTQKIACNPAEQLVKNGSSGNAVTTLQTILTGLGYNTKGVDGKFGPNTEKAVMQFQEKNSLVKDGIVGKNTWTKLCTLSDSHKLTDPLKKCIKPADGIAWVAKVSPQFKAKVIEISKRLGTNPDYLMSIMYFESGLNPSIQNKITKATGLIQIMPKFASSVGTTIEKLQKMTAVEQLDYVEKWFMSKKGKINDVEDMYMAVFNPAHVGKPSNFVLYTMPPGLTNKVECKGHNDGYCANAGLDINNDKKLTKGEAGAVIRNILQKGLACENFK